MGSLVTMHSFATNLQERKHIPFFIAAIAIGAAILTTSLFSWMHVEIPWWLPPIDTMSFYGLLLWIFDALLWKSLPIQTLRISQMPNLSGHWRGRVEPQSVDGVSRGLTNPINITVTIHQSWLGLLVCTETKESRSHSITASLTVGHETTLSYEYINEPLASATSTMHAHRGTARLTLRNDGALLEGEYYSGRDRQTFGTLRLKKSP
jgi:hypothetical protein